MKLLLKRIKPVLFLMFLVFVTFNSGLVLFEAKLKSLYSEVIEFEMHNTVGRLKGSYTLLLNEGKLDLAKNIVATDLQCPNIMGLGLFNNLETVHLQIKDNNSSYPLLIDFYRLLKLGYTSEDLTEQQFKLLFSKHEEIKLNNEYYLKVWFNKDRLVERLKYLDRLFINFIVIFNGTLLVSYFMLFRKLLT